MSWSVFPRIYTNLQSTACFHFSFQVRRPVISTIVDTHMSFYEKREIITEYFNHENLKFQHFFISEKTAQKRTSFSNLYLFKGPPFQYHKVRHPNFQ